MAKRSVEELESLLEVERQRREQASQVAYRALRANAVLRRELALPGSALSELENAHHVLTSAGWLGEPKPGFDPGAPLASMLSEVVSQRRNLGYLVLLAELSLGGSAKNGGRVSKTDREAFLRTLAAYRSARANHHRYIVTDGT